ncbi:MAG: hypothetical protein NT105_01595 [Verrucomicrobia bacterium]|nr:hypothetical protein [Verrucomicrobiota bacterium]
MKTHLIRAAMAALGMFLCAVVGGADQDYARAIAAVNRQIEKISEKPKVVKTYQRAVRIEYSAQDERVICFDKTGKAFLTLERRESGRFEGVFTTPAISPFVKGGHGVRASMLCPIYLEEKDLP